MHSIIVIQLNTDPHLPHAIYAYKTGIFSESFASELVEELIRTSYTNEFIRVGNDWIAMDNHYQQISIVRTH